MLIHGIIPPVATPLLSDSEIDENGLEHLINHLIEGGVHGLFLLGTTGEGTSLSYELRKEFVQKACRLVNKKVPVLAGITDTVFENSLKMAEVYKDAGADVLVLAPPYYNPVTQPEVQHYLEEMVPQLPLPFLLYNIPSHTKIHLTVNLVKHAKELGALGIKDSSGDITHMLSLVEAFKDSPEFAILTGTEIHISDALSYGAHGAVPGGANIFPQLYVDYYNAVVTRDYEKIEFFRKIVLKINSKLYNFGPMPSGIIMGIKAALEVLDICNGYVAHPLRAFDNKTFAEFKKFLIELKQYIEKEHYTEPE